jgi:glycosyltransferase involved in cell wall biosynthesis
VLGRVSDQELAAAYRRALCVIAPAYNEDYGLTALEAMQHAKPVIVCSDGGGLVDLVDHGVTGLVVEPSPSAIADAVRSLHADPGWARSLGAAGQQVVAAFTLERTRRQLLGPLREMMDA